MRISRVGFRSEFIPQRYRNDRRDREIKILISFFMRSHKKGYEDLPWDKIKTPQSGVFIF